MKTQDKIRKEMLLIATVTLNFVTELPDYQHFLSTLNEKNLTFEKGKREYYIAKKVLLSEATVQNVLYGSAKITIDTFNSIMDVEEFRELAKKIYKGIQSNNEEIIDKVTDIIENRIENKEFPKILDGIKKSTDRHYALPILLQNEKLLTNVLDYLPLIEKIFEPEENLTVFYQVAKRLDSFKLVDEYDDWDNLERYIKSVQTRNEFDSYLD